MRKEKMQGSQCCTREVSLNAVQPYSCNLKIMQTSLLTSSPQFFLQPLPQASTTSLA